MSSKRIMNIEQLHVVMAMVPDCVVECTRLSAGQTGLDAILTRN